MPWLPGQRGNVSGLGGRSSVVLVALAFILGCSAQRRYRTLSFLFDGVPDPNAPAEDLAVGEDTAPQAVPEEAPAGREEVAAVPRGSIHPPYALHACESCHRQKQEQGSRGGFRTIDIGGGSGLSGASLLKQPVRELCVTCHEPYSAGAATAAGLWLHGPVGAGACTFCHDQHSSPHSTLLRAATPRELCVQCHDGARSDDHPPPEELVDADCTDCHSPHRGDSRLLL